MHARQRMREAVEFALEKLGTKLGTAIGRREVWVLSGG